jgi:hypothetical protein
VHVLEPEEADVPAGQLAQTVESVTSADEAPGRAYLPDVQDTSSVQAAVGSPVVDPYLPAGHGEHVADPARE